MTAISFAQIFFAIAMLLQPADKTSKITISFDGKPALVFTLQADGSWHGSNVVDAPATDEGTFSWDKEKKLVANKPTGAAAGSEPHVLATSDMIKANLEKPDAMSIELQDKKLNVTRKGNEFTITPADPTGGGPKAVVIRYEP